MLINRREIYRYLGYGKSMPDDVTKQNIEQCIEEELSVISPRHVYREFDLEMEGDLVKAGNITFKSSNLSKNLLGCDKIILFAATLGNGPDRLMNKYQKLSISKAAICQAVAAAIIEEYCDECQRSIEELEAERGYYVRPRYSPGYGDLSLKVQEDLISAINAYKAIGLTLSDGNVMIPEKSVTALMGLSQVNLRCHVHGCETCDKTDCNFRRNS